MAESMIKKVARILEPQAWAALGTGDTLAYANRRVSSMRKARAVIEVMREPSRRMIDAAYDAHDAYEKGPTPAAWCGLSSAYKAMIDAALADRQEG